MALVVGNSAYRNVSPLTNPVNDATDLATKLRKLNFEVSLLKDASFAAFDTELTKFQSRITRDTAALFFFAGHGITLNRESFLVPVDAPAEIGIDDTGAATVRAFDRQLIRMARVLAPLEAARIGIVFLDACRTDARGTGLNLRVVSRTTKRTLPVMRGNGSLELTPSPYSAGVFRAYATQLDNVASDGLSRNSPFTAALLKNIETKGLSIQELMIRVRKAVIQETKGQQIPWEEAALNETFYFAPAAPTPSTIGTGTTAQPQPPRSAPRPSQPPARLPPNLGVGVGAGF